MADDRVKVAIETIARDVLAKGTRGGWLDDEWENYPEIGEHDWKAVVETAQRIAGQVDPEQYAAAYEFLAERAEE